MKRFRAVAVLWVCVALPVQGCKSGNFPRDDAKSETEAIQSTRGGFWTGRIQTFFEVMSVSDKKGKPLGYCAYRFEEAGIIEPLLRWARQPNFKTLNRISADLKIYGELSGPKTEETRKSLKLEISRLMREKYDYLTSSSVKFLRKTYRAVPRETLERQIEAFGKFVPQHEIVHDAVMASAPALATLGTGGGLILRSIELSRAGQVAAGAKYARAGYAALVVTAGQAVYALWNAYSEFSAWNQDDGRISEGDVAAIFDPFSTKAVRRDKFERISDIFIKAGADVDLKHKCDDFTKLRGLYYADPGES